MIAIATASAISWPVSRSSGCGIEGVGMENSCGLMQNIGTIPHQSGVAPTSLGTTFSQPNQLV
jgi:hypothetical protein